jgi:hypothetical protein
MSEHANPIAIENSKIGTSEWRLTNPAMNREIEGYASDCSINAGEAIEFFVNTHSDEFSITIYRMGWYGARGGRQIMDSFIVPGTAQKIPLPDEETGLTECDWINSIKVKTMTDWTSGIYIAKLQELSGFKQSYIIFVIRNDFLKPDILFQLPVTTYQAYNYWGGKNLYESGSGSLTDWGSISGKPATKVSFNRPYVCSNNPLASYGMGAGDFFTNTRPVTTHKYPISSAGWDYNMVRWMEKNAYNVGYVSSIDTHLIDNLHERCKIFLSHGHDEYWSFEMRDHVTKARDLGINLAFISSNTMFWQVRFEASKLNRIVNRTMVCYKDSTKDPVKGKLCSINFRDIAEQGSEASLIGINYILDPVLGDISIANSSHWVFNQTKLKNGSVLKGLLGYEVDALAANSPANIEVLASSVCQARDKSDYPNIIKYMINKIVGVGISSLERTKTLRIRKHSTLFLTFTFLAILSISWIVLKFGVLYLILFCLAITLFFIVWFIKIINSGKVTAHMTIYQAESGAFVFATGSMQWAWGLDDFNAPNLRPSLLSNEVDTITKTIFHKFGASVHKEINLGK